MNIVHIVRQFHPAVGGLENVVRDLVSAQVAAGHKVRVVTLNRLFKTSKNGSLSQLDTVQAAEIVRIPFWGSSRYPIAPGALRFVGDADIIHVHAIDFFFDFLAWTKPLHRKRLIVSTHGGFFHTQRFALFKKMYFMTITRLSLTWYDAVAAVSASDYARFAHIRRRGMACIENGVDVSKYGGASALMPAKVIATIGRFAANKRLDRVLKFLCALREIDPDWRLKVIGRPWDLGPSDLSGMAQEAGVASAVDIIVSPTESEIRAELGGCSVFVSASEFEGFGIAAVEGLSAGLLPVLNDIPTFRKLVENTGLGMIVDFSQPSSAITEFLRRWHELSGNYAELRTALISSAHKHSWLHASNAYFALYEAVIGNRTRRILDVEVKVWTRAEAVTQIDGKFEESGNTAIAFANANCLNIAHADSRVRIALQEATVLNDGIGVDLASKVLFGSQFPENLNGTDFMPYYLQRTRHCFRVYLLGGRAGVAERAARSLGRICPRHKIVGCRDGYFGRSEDGFVAQAIRAARADVVLVAMGNPEQELWLRYNLSASGCRLGFAVGAVFDFLTGEARRAPLWVRAARLEWGYRLGSEPKRLWRRYVLGNPVFMLRVLGQWWSGARI